MSSGVFGLASTHAIPWIFRVPNNWRAEPNGGITKDYETEEYRSAVAYTRELYAAGVFHPNSTTYNATALENDWKAGKVVSGINDPTLGLYSATYTARNNLLNTTFYSGVQEMVMGNRPLSDLDRLVKDWRDNGGDKSRAEFQQALAA